MNELIKETEKLYKQIDKAQVHLINARLNNDEEDKKSAISEIETAMCNAMQLLKFFIDRKDKEQKAEIQKSKTYNVFTKQPAHKDKVVIEKNCFYFWSLNEKNALKKLRKAGFIK